MVQQRFSIGTTPVLIANQKNIRRSIVITMLPTSVETGNTGRIHIGKGFPPTTTLGDPSQGDILIQGTQITEQEQFLNDPSVHKGQWWATASAAGQILTVDEVLKE